MSLHSSLKTKSGALEAHRNVLSRPERIARLKEESRFTEDQHPLGLPKVRNIKVATGKKAAKDAGDEAATPAPAAKGGKK